MPPCRWWQVCSAAGASAHVQYAATARSSRDVEALGDPPRGVVGGQVERARGDVDVGDLLRHGLELGERPAELRAALDVRRGQVARAGHHAGGGDARARRPRGRAASRAGVRAGQQVGRGAVEDDGVLRRARSDDGDGQQRDAVGRRVDQRDDDPVAVERAVTSSAAARSAYVTPILRPVTRPSAYVVVGRSGMPAPTSRSGGGEQTLAARDARQQPGLLLVAAGRGEGQRAAAERLPHRAGATARAPVSRSSTATSAEPEPLAAVRLRHRQRQQARPRRAPTSRPSAVERLPDHRRGPPPAPRHGWRCRRPGSRGPPSFRGHGRVNCNLF